jgi:hypothetical protein
MEKYGLGRFDLNEDEIKKVTKKEDFLNEQDSPEEIRLITNFNSEKNVLKITYPSGQKYFFGHKDNEKNDRVFYFTSVDKNQQRIKSFKFIFPKEKSKNSPIVKARIYEKGKIIQEKKVSMEMSNISRLVS